MTLAKVGNDSAELHDPEFDPLVTHNPIENVISEQKRLRAACPMDLRDRCTISWVWIDDRGQSPRRFF